MPPEVFDHQHIEEAVDTLCHRLSQAGHEAVLFTFEHHKQTVYWNGTKLGRAFVFQSSNIIKDFIDFCQENYRTKSESNEGTKELYEDGIDLGADVDSQEETLSDCYSDIIPLQNVNSKAKRVHATNISGTPISGKTGNVNLESESRNTDGGSPITPLDNLNDDHDHFSIVQRDNVADHKSSPATEGICTESSNGENSFAVTNPSYDSPESENIMKCTASVATACGNESGEEPSHNGSKHTKKKQTNRSFEADRNRDLLAGLNSKFTSLKRKDQSRVKTETVPVSKQEATEMSNDSIAQVVSNGEYTCQVCNKSLKLRSSLTRHMLMHSDKAFKCPECGKSFARKNDIVIHEAIHKNRTLLSCEICSQTFLTKTGKIRHMKKQHLQKWIEIMKSKGKKVDEATLLKEQLPLSRDFICHVCHIGFPRKASLKRHLATHNKTKAFRCYICCESFGNESELEEHVKEHNTTLVFSCPFCREIFNSHGEMRNHKEICESDRNNSCKNHIFGGTSKGHIQNDENVSWNITEKKSEQTENDVDRSMIHEMVQMEIKCENDVGTETTETLNANLPPILPNVSTGNPGREGEVKCDKYDIYESTEVNLQSDGMCLEEDHVSHENVLGQISQQTDVGPAGECFREEDRPSDIPGTYQDLHRMEDQLSDDHRFSASDRNTNLISNVGKILPDLSCDICGKNFRVPMALYKHKIQHDESGKFPCRFCHYVAKSKQSLQRHSHLHMENNPNICPVCEKNCPNQQALQQHMQTHTKERPHMCETCGKCFSSAQMLRIHNRNHTGERPYSCSFCNKTFRSADVLLNHERIHRNELQFQCEVCGAKFNGKANLYNHRRTHSKVRLFSCQKCNKSFKTAKVLTSHYISLHLTRDELPSFKHKVYECEACGKFFSQRNDFNTHQRIHTGEKPHVCDVCGKSFADKYNLRKHIKIHNNDRPHICQICGKGFIFNRDLSKHIKTHNKQKFREGKPAVVTIVEREKDKVVDEPYSNSFQQNLHPLNFF